MKPPNDRVKRLGSAPADRALLRLLLDPEGEKGELSPEEIRELRARLSREPGLAARFVRLRASWEALEPPPDALPPGFGNRVMARVVEDARRNGAVSLTAAPLWVRSAAALALALGVALGLLMSRLPGAEPTVQAPVEIAALVDAAGLEEVPNLADSYLSALERELGEGDLGEGDLEETP